MNTLYVIGIGYKPLDKRAKEIILNSEVILSSSRLFAIFQSYEEFIKVKDKIKVIDNVDETIKFISEEAKKCKSVEGKNFRPIVLLSSGDPMFFGIGRRIVKEFGKGSVQILPDLSSIQVAFSKIKEPWDDAFLMSLHGGPDPEKRRRLPYEAKDIPTLLQKYSKIAILTDRQNNPSTVAKELLEIPNLKIFVCERLGYPDERIIEGKPIEIAGSSFSEPNVIIILKNHNGSYVTSNEHKEINLKTNHTSGITYNNFSFGLKEEDISHSRGLITKDEVRAVTIHKLRLPQKGILWDIGAGSGSVAIEAARLYPELKIFAIEKKEEQIKHIEVNKHRFNLHNIEIIKGEAPDALKYLPNPDRVFIGGSGRLKETIGVISKMPVKIVVINAVTLETLNEASQSLQNNGFKVEVSEISVSRVKTIANKRHLSALNPIFVIVGEKW